MSGRQRLPSGEPRKASQRNTRRATPVAARIAPSWRAGDKVRWKGHAGVFRRDTGDGEHCEIGLDARVYRVPTKELSSAGGNPMIPRREHGARDGVLRKIGA